MTIIKNINKLRDFYSQDKLSESYIFWCEKCMIEIEETDGSKVNMCWLKKWYIYQGWKLIEIEYATESFIQCPKCHEDLFCYKRYW